MFWKLTMERGSSKGYEQTVAICKADTLAEACAQSSVMIEGGWRVVDHGSSMALDALLGDECKEQNYVAKKRNRIKQLRGKRMAEEQLKQAEARAESMGVCARYATCPHRLKATAETIDDLCLVG